ncbi:MAG: filamentous hemagglutinin N-terminal domain-containing protein [Myxococcota bacterium]
MPRRVLACLLCAALGLLPAPGLAVSGENVVEGQATFTRPDDHTTIIDTATEKTIVEYTEFDILQGDLVKINQPTDQSKIFNHVPHGDPTQIGGQLESNGFVYIVNPAGVFIGDEALIDVGGLVAAAGKLSYEDFLADRDRFSELGGEVVVAEGAMVRADQTVALLGRRVANYGTVISEGGMVAFIAGNEAVLGSLDGRMMVRVDGGGDPLPDDQFALVQAGTVDAGAGRVLLTAGDTYSLAMNHTGITRGHRIRLEAEGEGLVQVAGTLDASATDEGETGGKIRVLGEKIAVLDARLDASGDAGGGQILVGGHVQGGGGLRAADRTYVDALAELVADAITDGDGGTIVVWAEEKTGFLGSASARGGSEGGDGGFIEISGRESLFTLGHTVDLSAPHGSSGTLLYDPARILIVGGSADGDDLDLVADDPTISLNNNGTLGEILDGDEGDNDPDDFFIIYESEIEGTDADIILQASETIEIQDPAGTFTNTVDGEDDGTIRIMDGNSLVIQTTGEPADDFTGEYAIDLGLDVTWKVSGGGIIHIETSAGSVTDDTNDAEAGIRVGHLVFGGREYAEFEGLNVPLIISVSSELVSLGAGLFADTGVNVQTDVGSIVVGSITASGQDASNGGQTLASSGVEVRLSALSGDITVTDIDTTGGSAVVDESPGNGGLGGNVFIGANDGLVTVQGVVDASGGLGQAGLADAPELDEPEPFEGNGGQGGLISIASASLGDTPTAQVLITGQLITNGGEGTGEFGFASPAGTIPISGQGGDSGQIDLSADAGVMLIGADDGANKVVLQANGGQGRGGGGGSTSGIQSISIDVPVVDGTPDGGFDVVMINADLQANGGDVEVLDPMAGGPRTGFSGGAGGSGGGVLISAGRGSVVASDSVTITANGGDGAGALFPDGEFALPGGGGTTNVISIQGDSGVAVDTIVSIGGDGVNGNGEQGGSVDVSSAAGDVQVGNITVHGGSAAETVSTPQGVLGGAGGSVFLDVGEAFDGSVPDDFGDIVLTGRLVGFGGTGTDADGDTQVADGAFMNLSSEGGIEASPTASVEGGTVNLDAPRIGTGGAVQIAGTDAENDAALVQTPGEASVKLLGSHGPSGATGSGFEQVTVLHTDQGATSTLLNASDEVLLQVDAGDPDAMPDPILPTITQMGTGSALDPTLNFTLDEGTAGIDPDAPDVQVALGAGNLGANGGSIRNAGGDIVGESGGSGSDTHLATTGNLVLDALAIGGAGNPLRVDGDVDASLAVQAVGDVDIDTIDVGGAGAFGAIDVSQGSADASTTLRMRDTSGMEIESTLVVSPDLAADDPVADLVGDTTTSGSALAYRHTAPQGADEEAPALRVQGLALGANGTLTATGDIELANAVGPTIEVAPSGAGSDVYLLAGGAIVGSGGGVDVRLAGGAADDTADLTLDAGDGITGVGGSSGNALVTENVERIAAIYGGDMHLVNSGSAAGLEIAQVEVLDPTDRSGDTVEALVTGIRGGVDAETGDLSLVNTGGRIVLGEIPVLDPDTAPDHVSVTGDAVLDSPIEIENAQFVEVAVVEDDGTLGTEMVAVNAAGVEAGGNVLFTGSIDTGTEVTAVDPDGELPDEDLNAQLTVLSVGTATYQGDVGASRGLTRFDTTRAALAGGGTRTIRAGDIVLRGGLDSAVGDPTGAMLHADRTVLGADDEATVAFGGNVGDTTALDHLTVMGDDGIDFALAGAGSAESVRVTHDVHLETDVDPLDPPTTATITDTQGNLSIQSGGDFEVGDLERFTATGELRIASQGSVTVGDLSADRIVVDSADIIVMTRDPGQVELPDGSLVDDAGVDWVANDIVTTSAPVPDDTNETLDLYIGDGGVSIPGGLGSYDIRYANANLDAVGGADFFGQDGVVLDLTGNGPQAVGDPTRALPRIVDPSLPELPARFGSDPPGGAPSVSGAQVLAFLRCSGFRPAAGVSGGCGPKDQAALASVDRMRDGALATARAREITDRYRELLATPEAVKRLRAAFAEAGRAYGESLEWRDGTLDGADFYRFLASAPREQASALASVRELAWLSTQIDLLGLADADTRRLQRTLAQEFADAAGLQGLDADTVTAAVDASPVGGPTK